MGLGLKDSPAFDPSQISGIYEDDYSDATFSDSVDSQPSAAAAPEEDFAETEEL